MGSRKIFAQCTNKSMEMKYFGKKIHSHCSSWRIKGIFLQPFWNFFDKGSKISSSKSENLRKTTYFLQEKKIPANFALETLTALAATLQEKLSKTVRNTPAQNPKKSFEKTFFNKLFHLDVSLDTENAVKTTLRKVFCWKYCIFHTKSTKCS